MQNLEEPKEDQREFLVGLWQDVVETLKADAIEPEDAKRMEDAFAAVQEVIATITDQHEKAKTEEMLAQYQAVYKQKTKL